jgi:RimJ/RimL family protein N-acetyltransferase
VEIQTERLILRDLTPGDWPDILAYQNDPLYLRYYAWTSRSESEVRAFVQMLIDCQAEQPRRKFQVAITLPQTGQLIGNCGVRRKPENDWEADIGYELNPMFWHNGYATEAARAMVRYGFQELKVHRISAWCVADNVGSARVLEKTGLKLEGQLRENEFYKDRWWDTLLYGLLVDEWKGNAPSSSIGGSL